MPFSQETKNKNLLAHFDCMLNVVVNLLGVYQWYLYYDYSLHIMMHMPVASQMIYVTVPSIEHEYTSLA